MTSTGKPGRPPADYGLIQLAEHTRLPRWLLERARTEMRRWYCPLDLLGWPEERLVPDTASLAETTQRILTELCTR